MRTYKLTIVANNEAGSWKSWPQKIAAIKQFYAPVCELDVTLIPTHLTPQFAPYSPSSGNSAVYQIDEAWYEANVLPYAEGADIVMFVVPPTDHSVVTLMGLEAGHPQGQWETTVFADETSHTYVGEADQGETPVVYATHELSHVFYAMLAKTDNTHQYFFAGTPEKVLAEFDFEETLLAWYQHLLPLLKQWVAALQARQSPTLSPDLPSAPISSPASSGTINGMNFPQKIVQWSKAIAAGEGANPKLHNPGNLKFSSLTASWGAIKGPAASDGGFLCQFATDLAGENALCNFLVLGCEDELIAFHSPQARTLEGFTKIYAGNPPQGYIDRIVQTLGVPADTQISIFLM